MELFAIDFNNTFPPEDGVSGAPPDDPFSEPPKMENGLPPHRLFNDLSDDKVKSTLVASRIDDIVPAIVTIPAIFVLSVMLTLAIH